MGKCGGNTDGPPQPTNLDYESPKMSEKQSHPPQFALAESLEIRPRANQHNSVGHKPPFVKPAVICHGSVVDLTAQFQGSVTPDDAEYPFVY
jgi:hypothetical protein